MGDIRARHLTGNVIFVDYEPYSIMESLLAVTETPASVSVAKVAEPYFDGDFRKLPADRS